MENGASKQMARVKFWSEHTSFFVMNGGNLMPGIKFLQTLPRLGILTHAGYLYLGWVTLPRLGNCTQTG